MGERGRIEVTSQLAIDAGEQVKIESGGDSGGVVVGRSKRRLVLGQVDSDYEQAARTELLDERRASAPRPRPE